jgi:hypothetical protein
MDGPIIRVLSNDSVRRCPWFIFDPDHYRDNGTCRCDDPDHEVMSDWGYEWDGQRWTA